MGSWKCSGLCMSYPAWGEYEERERVNPMYINSPTFTNLYIIIIILIIIHIYIYIKILYSYIFHESLTSPSSNS
jgi:hypothetical protein